MLADLVRGLAPGSVDSHSRTVIEFLHYLHRGRRTFTVAHLRPHHVDGFIQRTARRILMTLLRIGKQQGVEPCLREVVVRRQRL